MKMQQWALTAAVAITERIHDTLEKASHRMHDVLTRAYERLEAYNAKHDVPIVRKHEHRGTTYYTICEKCGCRLIELVNVKTHRHADNVQTVRNRCTRCGHEWEYDEHV